MITCKKGFCHVAGDLPEVARDLVTLFKAFNEYKDDNPNEGDAIFSALWVNPDSDKGSCEDTKVFFDNLMKGYEIFKRISQ